MKMFLSMSPYMKRLVVEAFIYLGWARILKALPFSKIASSLGKRMEETPFQRDRVNEAELLQIAKAIHIVSRNTWWESKCLVMAIAGMKMLERRRINSTLYLGTARNSRGQMIAHAWLRSGPLYLTGADEMDKYTVVGIFGKTIRYTENQRSTING
ncbi:lasso peptide biosynthesis B2 protein [Paenibacillus solisilvae]|uniref:Lasso peptide biosynthesis B2 protein n=1 Tax=Paenibacillus solisilvae TaxID=2486751 RepID=A0ABW0W3W7_9BACL